MKRLLPFVVLILLILGALASIPFLLRPENQRTRIADMLSKTLRQPVVVGELSFGYLPPALKLGKVIVSNPRGEPYIQVEKVTVPLRLAALVRLKVEPEQIDLAGWRASITRTADGRWDYKTWWPGETGLSGAKTWTISRVHWQQGEIHWIDPFASTPQELILSLVEGSWNPRPETLDARGSFSTPLSGTSLTFAAKGQFFSQPRWTGDLEVAEQGNSFIAHLVQSPDGVEIRAQSNRWRLGSAATLAQFFARVPRGSTDAGGQMIENWQLHMKDSAGNVAFEQTAAIAGGQTEAKGSWAYEPGGIVARVDGAVSAIPAEALLTLTGLDLPVSGRVTGISKNMAVILSSQTATTLSGLGYVEVTDGHYQLPEGSLKKLAKAKTTNYLRKKYPDLTTTGFPFSKMSTHWKAKNGQVSIDNGMLISASLKASWAGTLDVARKGMDGYTRIDFREKDLTLKALIPAKYHTQPAFGRLQGSWQEWFLRALSPAKVPAAIQSKLRKASAQK